MRIIGKVLEQQVFERGSKTRKIEFMIRDVDPASPPQEGKKIRKGKLLFCYEWINDEKREIEDYTKYDFVMFYSGGFIEKENRHLVWLGKAVNKDK